MTTSRLTVDPKTLANDIKMSKLASLSLFLGRKKLQSEQDANQYWKHQDFYHPHPIHSPMYKQHSTPRAAVASGKTFGGPRRRSPFQIAVCMKRAS